MMSLIKEMYCIVIYEKTYKIYIEINWIKGNLQAQNLTMNLVSEYFML